MEILFYSTKNFEQPYLVSANTRNEKISFIKDALSLETAGKAKGFGTISIFAGDDASSAVLEELYRNGTRHIAIRSAGYDNVDINKAAALGIAVANVPAYSPYAIAEHTVALILALNRKLIHANQQVREDDFTVDNLVGFDLHDKTVGIIGVGVIGSVFAKIMHGFGCRLLGYDIYENAGLKEEYTLRYVDLPTLCRQSDIISLHTNLTPDTRNLINKEMIDLMQPGTMLVNTSRGACVNTADVIEGLKNGRIGYYGADVYEKEKGIFFHNWKGRQFEDELLERLLAAPNVLLTPHQAFATKDALTNIATTTFDTINCWKNNIPAYNELT